MLFRVGKVKLSRAVLESDVQVEDLISAFERYLRGDWGDGDFAPDISNDLALTCGERIVATYTAADGQKICMSTANGRTYICFPHEVQSLRNTVFT
ncbi:hypothetical protein GCM10025857_19540 [Alicyclobacillus contaminans]|uniref:hypothetical protein n=1 Tax=Alicyclobacillus contaminans TaxID=392016 RepID=UPI0004194FCF|nr:hypothetical protein [Alicyclobacillus contaminans]GMA50597.1 hypothetical protein GCM10025857_19540 [Alicyclobacillus contaminans]